MSAEYAPEWTPRPNMDLLNEGVRPAPKCDLAPFGVWEERIAEAAEAANAPPDFTVAALIAAASAAIGASRSALVDPERNDWRETCANYELIVGDASIGKTPSLKPIISMLSELETEAQADHNERQRQWLTDKLAAEREREKWEDTVRKAVDAGYAPTACPANCMDPEEPKATRYVTSDVTIEKLADLLQHNPRGLLVYRGEAAGLFANFERYGGNDRQRYLEMYDGDRLTVDRKAKETPIIVPRAVISLLGGIQPDRLIEFLRGPDDGLMARFDYYWPEPVPIARPMAKLDRTPWVDALRRLTQLKPDADGNQIAIPFSAAAADAFYAFRKTNADRVRHACGIARSWIGKGPGKVARLALVLELLDWADQDGAPEPQCISLEAVLAARAHWERYLLPMAERVFGDVSRPLVEKHAGAVLKAIKARSAKTINLRDIYTHWKLPGLPRDAAGMREIMRFLEEEDWILPAPSRAGASKGRAKEDYQVHPILWRPGPCA